MNMTKSENAYLISRRKAQLFTNFEKIRKKCLDFSKKEHVELLNSSYQ